MRLIGELGETQQANTFAAYLLVKGIETQIDDEGGKAEIWVKDEDRFEEASNELKAFQLAPTDDKYATAVQKAKALVKEEEKKRQKIQKNIVNVSGGALPRRRKLTVGLIVVTAIVGLLTNFGEDTSRAKVAENPVYRTLQYVCVESPESTQLLQKVDGDIDDPRIRFASILRGEIWRSFTTIFIHMGVFHIVFNMIWFFQFGTIIEHRYGWVKFGLLVLATAVISNMFQYGIPVDFDGANPGLTADKTLMTGGGGMSGVVYGLFGFIWMKSIHDRKFGTRLSQSTIVILIGWLLFCMIPIELRRQIGFGIPIGNWAHGIGLLVGMGVGYWTSIMKPK